MSISKKLARYGHVIDSKDHLLFFSHDNCALKTFKELKISFSILHQVHGSRIVQAPKIFEKADGQWTSRKGLALVIKTADCLPVFMKEGEKIIALHMGWRGFANNIFEAAMAHIKDPARTHLYIGPHIGFDSFQVDVITAANILRSQNLTWNQTNQMGLTKMSFQRDDHHYLNLQGILVHKATTLGFKNITNSSVDTFISSCHFSHRRNPFRAGTNYSMILRK